LFAALGTGEIDGMTIAVTHTVFNLIGILLIYPWRRIRYIPIVLAEMLAEIALRRKSLALGYTFVMFVAIPLGGILILR
jgi:sodium-dependent phosphate cotransporter